MNNLLDKRLAPPFRARASLLHVGSLEPLWPALRRRPIDSLVQRRAPRCWWSAKLAPRGRACGRNFRSKPSTERARERRAISDSFLSACVQLKLAF